MFPLAACRPKARKAAGSPFPPVAGSQPAVVADVGGAIYTRGILGDFAGMVDLTDDNWGILSAWVKLSNPAKDGTAVYVLANDGNRFFLRRDNFNVFDLRGVNAAAVTTMNIKSVLDYDSNDGWVHVVADLAKTPQLWVNGVYVNNSAAARGDVDLTRSNWGVGCASNGGAPLGDCIAELFFDAGPHIKTWREAFTSELEGEYEIWEYFATRDGKPRDLGADGSAVTGTQPICYFSGDATDFETNKGSGGDLLVSGTPVDCGSSPALTFADDCPVIAFRTLNDDYFARGADLTGNTDGKTGTLSFWAKINSVLSGTPRTFFANTGETLAVRLTSSATIQLVLKNAAGTVIADVESDTTITPGPWNHYLLSWDLATTTVKMYINDVEQTLTINTAPANDTIDYTVADWFVFSTAAGAEPAKSSLSEFWFANDLYLDIDIEGNRRFWYTKQGLPATLNTDPSRPGSTPIVWLNNGGALWYQNQGDGGDFSITGGSGGIEDANTPCS